MKSIKLFELKKTQTDFPVKKITSKAMAVDFIRQFYGDDIEIFESMFLLLLNNANITIGYAKISQGGITGTVVDVRIILKYALESLATNIIITHNHPSGKLEASGPDKEVTRKLKEACSCMDITLLDHLILTKDGMYSFANEGIL